MGSVEELAEEEFGLVGGSDGSLGLAVGLVGGAEVVCVWYCISSLQPVMKIRERLVEAPRSFAVHMMFAFHV